MRGLLIFFIFLITASSVFALEITSSAFENGSYIPQKYTCGSLNISPPFSWNNVPSGTKSFVIIGDDHDASFGSWVHWVVFNIPADKREFQEAVSCENVLLKGIIQGTNDFGKVGYGGPCPPAGKPHRYFFSLYALDAILSLKEEARKKDVVEAMKGHIIAETKVFGLYKR